VIEGFMNRTYLLCALLIAGGLTACGDDSGDAPPDAGAPDAVPPDAAPLAVTIPFEAVVNGAPFACGQTYQGVGASDAAYVASDFRFYVHDVRLLGAGGAVAVTLDANEWQGSGVALLDFEDGGVGCQMGTTGTHTAITGTVPPGSYTGVAFRVGVPFAQNHLDGTTAPAPLNVPAMYWAWSSGYKFLKADGAVDGRGFNLHLGSTGCGTTGATPPTAPCASPNVADVSLPAFAVGTGTVVADIGAVLADADVAVNTENTAPGCMSFPGDAECDTILPKLGLQYGANPAGTQAFFTVK
jgi:uncharacterized repeat protein (TIGR04052 family)